MRDYVVEHLFKGQYSCLAANPLMLISNGLKYVEITIHYHAQSGIAIPIMEYTSHRVSIYSSGFPYIIALEKTNRTETLQIPNTALRFLLAVIYLPLLMADRFNVVVITV